MASKASSSCRKGFTTLSSPDSTTYTAFTGSPLRKMCSPGFSSILVIVSKICCSESYHSELSEMDLEVQEPCLLDAFP